MNEPAPAETTTSPAQSTPRALAVTPPPPPPFRLIPPPFLSERAVTAAARAPSPTEDTKATEPQAAASAGDSTRTGGPRQEPDAIGISPAHLNATAIQRRSPEEPSTGRAATDAEGTAASLAAALEPNTDEAMVATATAEAEQHSHAESRPIGDQGDTADEVPAAAAVSGDPAQSTTGPMGAMVSASTIEPPAEEAVGPNAPTTMEAEMSAVSALSALTVPSAPVSARREGATAEDVDDEVRARHGDTANSTAATAVDEDAHPTSRHVGMAADAAPTAGSAAAVSSSRRSPGDDRSPSKTKTNEQVILKGDAESGDAESAEQPLTAASPTKHQQSSSPPHAPLSPPAKAPALPPPKPAYPAIDNAGRKLVWFVVPEEYDAVLDAHAVVFEGAPPSHRRLVLGGHAH
jgi:hypothetical protein